MRPGLPYRWTDGHRPHSVIHGNCM